MTLLMTLIWIGLAIVAVGVEFVATSFIFLFVAVAALVAAGLALLTIGLPIQLVVFAVLALLLPVLLRRQLVRRFSGRGVASRTDALIGATMTKFYQLDAAAGRAAVNLAESMIFELIRLQDLSEERVLLAGTTWTGRPAFPEEPEAARSRDRAKASNLACDSLDDGGKSPTFSQILNSLPASTDSAGVSLPSV
jgi:membrane protein implicated in regulation of membrane protease activity